MRWIRVTLDAFKTTGIMLGRKEGDKYITDEMEKYYKGPQEAHKQSKEYILPVDQKQNNCTKNSTEKCMLSKILETRKEIGVFDFEELESQVPVPKVLKEKVLGYKFNVILLSFSYLDTQKEYSCTKCFFRHRFRGLINRLDYAPLECLVFLPNVDLERKITLIGLKKKTVIFKKEMTQKEKEDLEKRRKEGEFVPDEDIVEKKMVALGVSYGGKEYLISIDNGKINFVLISGFILQGGVSSRDIYHIKGIDNNEKDIIYNKDYKVLEYDIDSIYYSKNGDNNTLVNILTDNYDSFSISYKNAYPGDTMFSDIRNEVKKKSKVEDKTTAKKLAEYDKQVKEILKKIPKGKNEEPEGINMKYIMGFTGCCIVLIFTYVIFKMLSKRSLTEKKKRVSLL